MEVAQDVTDATLNDGTVLAVAHELHQLVYTANVSIFGIDVDGNVNECNNKTTEITGYSREEAIHIPLVCYHIYCAYITPKRARCA